MRFPAATWPLDVDVPDLTDTPAGVDVPDGSLDSGEVGPAPTTDTAGSDLRNDGFAPISAPGSSGPGLDPGELLRRLTRGLDCLTHVEQVPPRAGSTSDWPSWVPADLRAALRTRGVERPWSHQATAADLAHNGRHVVVSTGTASDICDQASRW